MSEKTNTEREYYGPPRKLNDVPRREEEIRSSRGMPGGKSYAENLTKTYGNEGKGWEFSKEAYNAENQLESAETSIQHTVAMEALGNKALLGSQVTNEGVPLSNARIDAYTRAAHPPLGDILVYPDGDAHAAQTAGKQ